MAVSFVARKCSQCAGKLQYIKDKKIWKCLYCGAEIEREEQYDGLFTIKNVVRQVLKDTAYRRLDSAAKNLIECEKIDSRYVGTLIAKISYEMICVTTPGGCEPKDAKGIFSQLKKNYEQLKSISTSVTDEEEALYDFFDESDIFATLILVYDSLNDIARRDFVVSMLNAKEVYSKPANSNLLTYALKNKNFDIANQIITNGENLDVKSATIEVLKKYPDGDDKSKALQNLLDTNILKYSDKTIVEDYLSTTTDSISMKASVLALSLQHGIKIELERAMTLVISKSDCDDVKKIVSTYCKEKLTDDEIYTLLSFAYDCGNRDIAVCTLNCLKESNQYVLIPAKLVIAMLSSNTYSADDKVVLLESSFAFKIDNKSLEGIVTNYLCFNLDNADERQEVIECLFEKVANFPTSTVESYVLKCAVDATNMNNETDGSSEFAFDGDDSIIDTGTDINGDIPSNEVGEDIQPNIDELMDENADEQAENIELENDSEISESAINDTEDLTLDTDDTDDEIAADIVDIMDEAALEELDEDSQESEESINVEELMENGTENNDVDAIESSEVDINDIDENSETVDTQNTTLEDDDNLNAETDIQFEDTIETDETQKVLKRDEFELLSQGNKNINDILDVKADDYRDKGFDEDEIARKLENDKLELQQEFLNDAFPNQDVAPAVFNGFEENRIKEPSINSVDSILDGIPILL